MDRIVVSVPNLQVNFDEIKLKPRLLSVSSKSGVLVAAVGFLWLSQTPYPEFTCNLTGY